MSRLTEIRVERIGAATLYLGDCLQLLQHVAADAVITDPPYGISHVTSYGATWEGTQIAGDGDTSARDSVIAWAGERPWAIWGSYKAAAPAGFKAKIVWDKGPAFGAGDLKFPWKPSFEECWIAGKGWKADYRDEGVWRGPVVVSWESVAGGRSHPHQKPVWLFERLIKALPAHPIIFDPFMGSGTTGCACASLGRPFVGVEIDQKYFEIACQRIENAQRQERLFA